jgi:uncharacterized OB-fold protein
VSETRSISDDLLGRDDDRWHLIGLRCRECGETAFGLRGRWCQHCGSDHVDPTPLGDRGTLWSFTVVRNPPPGQHYLAEPFRPLAIGLVEIEQAGVRVLAPLEVPLDRLAIGLPVRLDVHVLYRDDADTEVMAFRFKEVARD